MAPRTPEQKAADQALTDAIDAVYRAYNHVEALTEADGPVVLTDYVVVCAFQGWDSDGDQFTQIMLTPRDGDMPVYRILGLLDYGVAREKAIISEPDDEEE